VFSLFRKKNLPPTSELPPPNLKVPVLQPVRQQEYQKPTRPVEDIPPPPTPPPLLSPQPKKASERAAAIIKRFETPQPLTTKAVEEAPPKPKPVEIRQPKKRERLIPEGPIFVNVNDYQSVLDCMNNIRNSIKESENIILRLNELKTEEEKEFEKWRSELEDIQKKLTYIDRTIFEAE